MKRKWKWFVLLLLAVVFFVAVIWFIPGKNVPVQVTEGELSDAEKVLVLTWASTNRLIGIGSCQMYKMSAKQDESVISFADYAESNSLPMFVFKGSNGWSEASQHRP